MSYTLEQVDFHRSKAQQRREAAAALRKVKPSDLKRWGVSKAALTRLEGSLHGPVTFFCDPDYFADAADFNPAFFGRPFAICHCDLWEDVAYSLAFARKHCLRPVIRSSGHSMAGYSVNNGLVIDVSRLNHISVHPEEETATIGTGATFERLIPHLHRHGVGMVTGSCPTVAVGGFTMGGGYGFTSREFGMACDNVLAARVMLADCRVVRATQRKNPDPLWALRGGTGNNFGVLLDFTSKVHPRKELWAWGIRWSLQDAPKALATLQRHYMSRGASPKLGYQAFITKTGGRRALWVRGLYSGPKASGRRAIQRLLEVAGSQQDLDRRGSYQRFDEILFAKPPAPNPPKNPLGGLMESALIDKPLGEDGWRAVIEYYTKAGIPWNEIAIEPYGGAINAFPLGANSFVHRDADMDVALFALWNDPEDGESTAQAWLDGMMKVLEPYGNGHSYQNYPNPTQLDYRWRYWGAYFPLLLQIKQKYDPDCVFQFPQDVSPDPQDDERLQTPLGRLPGARRLQAQIARPIAYEDWSDLLATASGP